MYSHGQLPDQAPDKEFKADDLDNFDGENEGHMDLDEYEDLGFDENWN